MLIKFSWLKNLNLCIPTSENNWSWLVGIASRMVVFLFSPRGVIIFRSSSDNVVSSRRKFWESLGSLSVISFNKF
jgi:hypothetical protein